MQSSTGSTSINVILKCQSAIADEIKGKKLEYIYATLVCGNGGISVSRMRKNARASSCYRCVHINKFFFKS